MDQIVTGVVAAAGVLLGIISTTHAIVQGRGKRFNERAKGLAELAGVLKERGPLQTTDSASKAEASHQTLLNQLETEIRANAILYLDSVSRLRRPGSYLISTVYLLYGGLMAYLAVSGTFTPTAAIAQQPGAVNVAQAVIMIGALTLITLGTRAHIRRNATLRLRARMGVIDPVSIEGVVRTGQELKQIFEVAIRRTQRQ
jgi:hypothetical protein